MLAYDRESTLWDAARLLSVGEEGYSYRARVGARVRTLPEFKEISEFFTAELTAQLADARSMTTAKLDAPVNKLARLLNSQSIKRVLLNDSLRVDLDRVIAGGEVLVVKGALGVMGAGNTSVLMQLLVGMLDAALARQQDLVPEDRRVAVALKVDEAPLVLNRGFAETMALKRSAGLETVACWQTEAQWTEREVRDQLDALFAHRVYFATASVRDARTAVQLTMAEFSDQVHPGIEHLSALGHPDARLHLPRHHAIASWSTPAGRQAPFVAETIPLRVDPERVALHAARQAERGGSYRTDLRQPHWDRERRRGGDGRPTGAPTTDTTQRTKATEQRSELVPVELAGRDWVPEVPADRVQPQRTASARACTQTRHGSGRRGAENFTEPENPAEQLSRARRPRRRAQRALGQAGARATDAETRAARPRDPRARRLHAARAQQPDPPSLQPGAGGHDDAAPPEASVGRGSGAALSVPPPRRWRRADVLRDHAARSRAAARPRPAHGGRGGRRGSAVRTDVAGRAGGGRPCAARRAPRRARRRLGARARACLDGAPLGLRGASESVLSPPLRSTPDGRRALGPADLTLPGGRSPHEFLRTDSAGARVPVERFETVRPDLTIELPGRLRERIAAEAHAMETSAGGDVGAEGVSPESGAGAPEAVAEVGALDLLVELDDRLPAGRGAGKLERYDHLLAGWSVHTTRYGRRLGVPPAVVFVCRDRARARECARGADALLTACRAYAGEYPADWEYSGREGILFVAERDAHEGVLRGYGVPRLPPEVRVSVAGGDPRAREATAEPRALLEVG